MTQYEKLRVENGRLVITDARAIPQSDLSAECFKFRGLVARDDCEARDTDECGGQAIRKTLKNELGRNVPLGRPIETEGSK